MTTSRQSGVLLHITSLGGSPGIGDLGQPALHFIDFLAASKQTLWQILPLGPTGACNSPYTPFSAFAGNPLLIDLGQLQEAALLTNEELQDHCEQYPGSTSMAVDFSTVIPTKQRLLQVAFKRFVDTSPTQMQAELADFSLTHQFWLEDYCLYMALKDHYQGAAWTQWSNGISKHQTESIDLWKQKLATQMDYHCFVQFIFFKQWARVKDYARQHGVTLIGDLPLFVAHDSADVWANRQLFDLDANGIPTHVAGVPPDYFCELGQLWGNPLYNWDRNKADNYRWWVMRFRTLLGLVDLVRIDHFRGFEAFWRIPIAEKTAVHGAWDKGPGVDFFHVLRKQLGSLPIIAEDLGFITPEVIALREAIDLPGMRVLQFAFDGLGANVHSPHNHVHNCVAYTGTHDNDTTLGWYTKATADVQAYARKYLASNGEHFSWDCVRAVLASSARQAIIPLQDLLQLGTDARMNTPGTTQGNWQWRAPDVFSEDLILALADLTTLYER